MTSRLRNPHLGICLALFAAAAGLRAFIHFHKFDDAFITFRYARNLLQGNGMVYNAGERVLGTTTPLFTVLLAAAGFIFRTGNFPAIADWINRFADGGTTVLIYLIAWRLWSSRALAAVAGLFFAFSFHSVFYSSTGMETSFFTFLAVFSMERMIAGRARASLLIAALALLTRPDALLAWAIVGGMWVMGWKGRKGPEGRKGPKEFREIVRMGVREAWPAGVMLGIAGVALWIYFGSVVPHSMKAKTVLCPSTGDPQLWVFPNRYDVMMFWAGFLSKTHTREAWPNYLFLFPTAALFGAGCFELARRNRRALALPALALLFSAAYAKSPVFMFPWYLVPAVPGMVLTIFAGLLLIANRVARIISSSTGSLAFSLSMTVAVLVLQSLCFIGARQNVPSAVARTMYPRHLEAAYRAAIERVTAENPGARVLTPEIGFIGWYGPQARIIDAGGLTCPELVHFHKTHHGFMKNNELVNGAIIEHFQPDWIITLRTFFDEGLPESADFKARYEAIDIPLKETEKVLVFRRMGKR